MKAILTTLFVFACLGVAGAQTPTAPGPPVTVSKLTAAETAALKKVYEQEAAAQTAERRLKRSIVEAHGGYVDECDQVEALLCGEETGMRLSDGVEWKGEWIILTKKWLPDL